MSKVLDLTLQQVEDSKVYVSQNKVLSFEHPMDYLSPFMDILNPLGVDWSFIAEKGSENKNEADSSETNIAYSRLIAKAKLPSEFDTAVNDPRFKHIFGEIGFVYALDTAKPEMKVYRGNRVSVCTNQCIFGADSILQMVMTDAKASTKNIYEKAERFVENAAKDSLKVKQFTEMYSNEVYREQMIQQKFGQLMQLGIENIKLGITPASGAIQEMLNPKSSYSVEKDKSITAWKFYNAVTEVCKKSSILDEASKVMLLEKMFPLPKN